MRVLKWPQLLFVILVLALSGSIIGVAPRNISDYSESSCCGGVEKVDENRNSLWQ